VKIETSDHYSSKVISQQQAERKKMFLVLSFIVLGVPAVVSKLYTEDVPSQKQLWEQYKKDHNREYRLSEENIRFSNFVQNLKRADELHSQSNDGDGARNFGITRFFDMSDTEFKSFLNTKFPSPEELSEVPVWGNLGSCIPSYETVNWAGQVTTPIKDQGSCGSCWAFAAVEQVESDIMINFGMNYTYELSEEQLMDCARTPDTIQRGCAGGNPYYAFKYMLANYIEPDSTYPYSSYKSSKAKKCNYQANEGVAGLHTYYRLPQDEGCMAKYVQDYGPITIGVNADAWLFYNPSKTGDSIMTAEACGTGPINHAVQIVGVSIPGNYWIVRNTWGTRWGQDGYIWLEYGKNTCNMSAHMNGLFTEPFLHTAIPSNSSSSTDSGETDVLSTLGGVGGLVGIIIGLSAAIFLMITIAWWVYNFNRSPLAVQGSAKMTNTETVREVI